MRTYNYILRHLNLIHLICAVFPKIAQLSDAQIKGNFLQDVAEIMTNLSKLVNTQGEEINTIEQNVEKAKVETSQGLLEIIRARRAKFASVPVAGAVVG